MHAPKLLEPFLLHHLTLYYFAPQLRFILRVPIPSDFCLNPKIITPLSLTPGHNSGNNSDMASRGPWEWHCMTTQLLEQGRYC